MICNSVIPCLFSGSAKNNKIMSMFVPFSRVFWPSWKFGFYSKIWGGGGGTNRKPKQSNRMFLVNFSKVHQ